MSRQDNDLGVFRIETTPELDLEKLITELGIRVSQTLCVEACAPKANIWVIKLVETLEAY